MQRRLQENDERFRTLTENAFDLICEVDERGHYQYLSPNHRDILGWNTEEMIGRNCLDVVHPDQRELAERRLRQAAQQGSGAAQVQVQAADGRWLWMETTGQSYRTASGDLRLVLISRDITARREAEERLRREQEFQRRLLALQDADRRLMAYEIHDGLVQDLYGALLFFESLEATAAFDEEERKIFVSALHLVRGAIEEARRLINGLRPPILDEKGLIAALEHLAGEMEQTWGIALAFHAQVEFDRLSPTVENAVYRIVQEALNNVRKHAEAGRAAVTLTQSADGISVVVEDDGKGFDPSQVSEKSYGLAGIRDRVRLLGGQVQIDSHVGAGTRITVNLPSLVENDPAEVIAPSVPKPQGKRKRE